MLRDTFLDTVQLARVVMAMEEVDPSRVAVNGVSQEGGLSLACAALVPEIRTALVRYPFLCDYKRVWQMGMDVDAYSGIRSYFRFYDPAMSGRTRFSAPWGTWIAATWPPGSPPTSTCRPA